MKYIFYSFIFMVVLISGCTTEEPHILEYPTTFTFNTPLLQERGVYKIDNSNPDGVSGTWSFTLIIEDAGSFDRSDADVSDTLNYLIRQEFSNNMISKITLLSANEMEIETGRLILDTLSHLKDQIEVLHTEKISYQPQGNFLMPGMYLNNESRDIYICNEFIYANSRISQDSLYFSYFRNDCSGADSRQSLLQFVNDNDYLRFDTASVEYVNYIFSSFK